MQSRTSTNHSSKKGINYLIYPIFFLVFFVLNRLTFYVLDDYTYHFVYHTEFPSSTPQPITGIWSLFQSQYNHYFVWNGRFVAHTLVQLFMQWDKLIFDFFNSLAICLLLYILMKFLELRTKSNLFLITLSALYLWWWLPNIGGTVFWVSGSGNYLWTSLVYMTFLYLFYRQEHIHGMAKVGLMSLAFLAGACNENTSPTILLMCGILTLVKMFQKKGRILFQILVLLSGAGGFLFMISSPGSLTRAHSHHVSISTNIRTLFELSIQFYWIPYVILILLFILCLWKHALTKKDIGFISLFLIGHMAAIYSLALSPEIYLRTFFGASLFLGIILLLVCQRALHALTTQQKGLFLVPLLVLFLIHYHEVYKDLATTSVQVEHQYQLIKDSQKNDVIAVPSLTSPKTLYNAYVSTGHKGTSILHTQKLEATQLGHNPDGWLNQWMAKYFKVRAISGY